MLILAGTFNNVKKIYRSKDGRSFFGFEFVDKGNHIEVYCPKCPSLNDRDPDPHKTHRFRSGKLCFVSGKEPRTQARAEELAVQWAEYYLEYRRTGVTRN